jgi:hypothetical protein
LTNIRSLLIKWRKKGVPSAPAVMLPPPPKKNVLFLSFPMFIPSLSW